MYIYTKSFDWKFYFSYFNRSSRFHGPLMNEDNLKTGIFRSIRIRNHGWKRYCSLRYFWSTRRRAASAPATQLYTGAANLLFIDCTGHTLCGRACKTAKRHVWHDRLTPRRTLRHRSTGLRSAFFNYRLPRVTWCRVRHTVKNRYVPINTSSRLKRFSRYVFNPPSYP